MPREGYTGAHVDNVYMSRGSDKVLTMWTPFCDITPDIGTLAVCESSNRLPRYKLSCNKINATTACMVT